MIRLLHRAWVLSLVLSLAPGAHAGVGQDEFVLRRGRIGALLDSGSAAVFRAPEARSRNGDVSYPYRQESSILYLTGLNRPGVALILAPGGVALHDTIARVLLFIQKAGDEAGATITPIADGVVLDWSRFAEVLNGLCPRVNTLYASPFGTGFVNDWLNNKPLFIERESRRELERKFTGLKVKNAGPVVAQARVRKSPAEVELIRRAIAVTGDGIRRAAEVCATGALEYELQAALEGEMIRQGASGTAFPSIIGSGPNALILHYDENRRRMTAGEVVVVDVGAEMEGYAADVTRTFPVAGKFTPEQEDVYRAVLEAQQAVFARIRAGLPWGELDAAARNVLTARGYGKFWRHSVSHHLGLDVHDTGVMDTLRSGMVITVEPGVYIPVGDTTVAVGYRGIGVRIEDDVLVTTEGGEVLSARIPKTPSELARWMKRRPH